MPCKILDRSGIVFELAADAMLAPELERRRVENVRKTTIFWMVAVIFSGGPAEVKGGGRREISNERGDGPARFTIWH